MPRTNPVPPVNRLIAALARKDRQHLLANCEQVDLKFSDVLCEAGSPIRHVYFPTDSIVSLVIPVAGHIGLEVGLVGNEGVLGMTLLLDVDVWPHRAVVQGAGPAWRMQAATFRHELEDCAALQRRLKRYLYVSLRQLAQSAACARFHVVEARLARWLLMTQDRAHADDFHVTQEFLAYMLGVRRVGVTEAAGVLQRRQLIVYRRGHITVLDRGGLEQAACDCYEVEKAIYHDMLG